MRLRSTIILALLLVFATAHAEDRQKARELFREGSQHYNLGEYKEALTAFKDAYRNYEDPQLLFNVAQCERQLGQNAEAIASYRAYLRAQPDVANRDEVKQLIAGSQAALEQSRAVRPQPPAEPPPSSAIPSSGVVTPSVAAVTQTIPSAAASPKPLYKKGWFWGTLAAVVVVGAGVAVAVALTRAPSYPSASTPDGTIRF